MIDYTHPALKAECRGSHTLSTRIDREMNEFLDRQAERAEVTKAEVVRRLLDLYRRRPDEINREVDL